jgi:hypothetical protein
VTYYIEGAAADGTVICGHGTDEYPLKLMMSEDAPLLSPIGGMTPQECLQCEDGDVECQKKLAAMTRADKAAGETCTTDNDCVAGLICDPEMFVCGEDKPKEPKKKKGKGPQVFYATLTGGTGVGFVSKDMQIEKAVLPETSEEAADPNFDPRPEIPEGDYARGKIATLDRDVNGFSWSGIPVRLALGYQITEKLSIEVSGRLDAFVVSNSTPVSCLDAAGGDLGQMVTNAANEECNITFDDAEYTDEQLAEMGEKAIAYEPRSDGTAAVVMEKEYQIAWMVNARVRFKFLSVGSLAASVFGGVGYGHFQYRVKDVSSDSYYYPMPGMVDIEVGLGLAYYFSRHVGLVFDIPIDFLVGDGFAANFDFNLGLAFGF